MTGPAPFTIDIPQATIDGILEKVRAYQWHEMPEVDEGTDRWGYGALGRTRCLKLKRTPILAGRCNTIPISGFSRSKTQNLYGIA